MPFFYNTTSTTMQIWTCWINNAQSTATNQTWDQWVGAAQGTATNCYISAEQAAQMSLGQQQQLIAAQQAQLER